MTDTENGQNCHILEWKLEEEEKYLINKIFNRQDERKGKKLTYVTTKL